MEPQFYSLLLDKLSLDKEHFSDQMNRHRWPEYAAELAIVFLSKTRDEWCDILEGSDVCFAPVLSLAEAPNHPPQCPPGDIYQTRRFHPGCPEPTFQPHAWENSVRFASLWHRHKRGSGRVRIRQRGTNCAEQSRCYRNR